MYVICTDDSGFEDMLSGPEVIDGEATEGSIYLVEEFGENSYRVYDDKDVLRWFGDIHFTVVEQPAEI